MITATFYRKKDNTYTGFTVSGHAGYAEEGHDIVCAAVSALTINTVNAIEMLTADKSQVVQDKSGSIKFEFISQSDDKGQLLVSALCLGLTELYKEYGDDYLRVYFKEV